MKSTKPLSGLYSLLILTSLYVSHDLVTARAMAQTDAFYRSENSNYTIVDSVLDSLRFTITKTLIRNSNGNLESISTFVNPEGQPMKWHDFGALEGPGWAANAVGGALEIFLWARFLNKPEWEFCALKILDHILDDGFIDFETGFIKSYRIIGTPIFCLNFKHNSDWFCPGSMAKIAYQMLLFSDYLGNNNPSAKKLKSTALKTAQWIQSNVESTPNNWFPRRTKPDGRIYQLSAEGGSDPLWQESADGLFILQLFAGLTERKLADYRSVIKDKIYSFINAGGIFGSINHDTYDKHENVAYAVAFRVLFQCSKILNDQQIRRFAYDRCLTGLNQFMLTNNINGVETKGLLYMEKSWDTAYLWENAEASLAWFEAAKDLQNVNPVDSKKMELFGLTVLRSISKHHHGEFGFLTEGVDWNNHVGAQHHINNTEFGDIQYTEPFLNNQHIAEPTLFYLTNLANVKSTGSSKMWIDCEGNIIFKKSN
jgi:hypothetical protein